MTIVERNQSFPEYVILKTAEYGGVIGGLLFLLNSNIIGAAVSGGIALVAALIDKRNTN